MDVSTDSSEDPVVGGTRQSGGCQSAGAPNNETLVSHDGRCGSRVLLLGAGLNTPPGVDLAMGRDPETLKFLFKWRVEAALLCKGAYDGGTQEERELMDIFLSDGGHDSFASWFEAKSFDDSEMPNTPRDSRADHLLMSWLAKRLGVTLFFKSMRAAVRRSSR